MEKNYLEFYRKKKNISQRELGEKVGVSGAYICQVENNQTKVSLETLNKIAEVLEVSPEKLNLIDDNNEPFNSLFKYESLEGKEGLRFELYDWLKSKRLSVRQALDLINLTKAEIIEARNTEINKMML